MWTDYTGTIFSKGVVVYTEESSTNMNAEELKRYWEDTVTVWKKFNPEMPEVSDSLSSRKYILTYT